MKNNYFSTIILTGVATMVFADQPLWDLGVIINNDPAITYQREINLDSIEGSPALETNIRALHSNNFIPPIIQEIKNSQINTKNIVKKYDELVSSLSTSDKISSIKKSFLSKKFSSFFSFYKSLNKDHKKANPSLDLMYVQNLYFSNKFKEAKRVVDSSTETAMTPELLLYKIKINIKLKNTDEAHTDINYFTTHFIDSDLMQYVIYEKKLLESKQND